MKTGNAKHDLRTVVPEWHEFVVRRKVRDEEGNESLLVRHVTTTPFNTRLSHNQLDAIRRQVQVKKGRPRGRRRK